MRVLLVVLCLILAGCKGEPWGPTEQVYNYYNEDGELCRSEKYQAAGLVPSRWRISGTEETVYVLGWTKKK